MRARDVFALAACALVVLAGTAACTSYADHCVGVVCADGEACVDLASGPVCVCDNDHVDVDGGCAAAGEGEGEGEGAQ